MKGVTAIHVMLCLTMNTISLLRPQVIMFNYKHNHITQAPSDCVSEVHCCSSVLPVNMKGVTAIDVMLCLTINTITLLRLQVIVLVKSTVVVVSYQLT